MDDNRLPKEILNYKPEGRRNIGRPQTRWEDDFRELMTMKLIDTFFNKKSAQRFEPLDTRWFYCNR